MKAEHYSGVNGKVTSAGLHLCLSVVIVQSASQVCLSSVEMGICSIIVCVCVCVYVKCLWFS